MKSYSKILFFGIILEILFLLGKTNSSSFFILSSLLLLISIFFLNKQEILYLLIFLIPNQRLLTFQENGVSVINGLFIYLFIRILLNKKNIKIFILPSLILISYGLILVNFNDSFFEFFIIIKLLITSFVLFSLFTKKKSAVLHDIIIYFILGALVTALLSFFTNSSFQIGGFNRFTGGIGNEPNYAGSLYSLSLALFLFINKRLNFNQIIKIIIPLLFLFFGFLTMSRSFILSSTIIILVYFFYRLKEKLIYTLLFLLSILFLFLEKIINFYNNSTLFQILTERIINPRGGDVSGGRLGFWSDYWDLITSTNTNLFFGVGSLAFKKYNIDQVAHNFFLEDMTTFGLIGVLLIYSYLFFLFTYFKREKITINILLPLSIFLINSFTLHSFLGMGGVTMFFICLIPFYIIKNQ